eukprot:TRINITY_DN15294_c0_g1_i2.p1 TRINITY_DN15294_c0_g1~~TRINITY_DN15294_c0_g1_i2.p1  ORF type:complete len:324 (-),score=46.63 TRINITY_DN15294_c0_g1_i2:256-1227(-)
MVRVRREVMQIAATPLALQQRATPSITEGTMWKSFKDKLLLMAGMSNDSLIERASIAFARWQAARCIEESPAELLSRWREWAPPEFLCTSIAHEPAITRVSVMGCVATETNSCWGSKFMPIEERKALVTDGKLPAIDLLLAHVVAPAEAQVVAIEVFKHVLAGQETRDQFGFHGIVCPEHNMIVVCIGKDSKPFLGLLRSVRTALCSGAIAVHTVSVCPLPPSKYLTPLPEASSLFRSFADSVTNLIWPATSDSNRGTQPPQEGESAGRESNIANTNIASTDIASTNIASTDLASTGELKAEDPTQTRVQDPGLTADVACGWP